jgi:hypothetical protein
VCVVWWQREKKEVSDFLYVLLVGDAPRGYAKTVAQRMGVPYPTLSKYWLGKRRFPASLVKPLFFATDYDPRVAEFFLLGGSGFRLVRTEPEELRDLTRALMQLGTLEGQVHQLYLAATTPESEAGEAISDSEAELLRAAIERLIHHAERLQSAFRSGRQ